jgi:transposase
VKREELEFLADNTHFTKRFAYFCGPALPPGPRMWPRSSTLWDAVKELDKQYMAAQLARAGMPGPKVIGIDEISIRKGHTYSIVVSDLLRRRPIWFGGTDRSKASVAAF